MENDLSESEKARRAFADHMENLAGAKEAEVTRLRSALQSAQASLAAQPPKKTVVDDDAPPKKVGQEKDSSQGKNPHPSTRHAPQSSVG